MDVFRLIKTENALGSKEHKQTTSNIGHLYRPTIVALVHGLNRYYYSLPIETRKTAAEERILMKLGSSTWSNALSVQAFKEKEKRKAQSMHELLSLAKAYTKSVGEELKCTPEALKMRHIGKKDPMRHLDEKAEELLSASVLESAQMTIAALAV